MREVHVSFNIEADTILEGEGVEVCVTVPDENMRRIELSLEITEHDSNGTLIQNVHKGGGGGGGGGGDTIYHKPRDPPHSFQISASTR